MNKQCTQCSASFNITDEDLQFYDKVSPVIGDVKHDIPAPTMCPECRLQRRFTHRNDRKLYKRKEDFTGEQIITMFSPESPVPVMHKDEWFSDRWDATEYCMEYDFNRPFFDQFFELQAKVPRAHLATVNTENADYTNYNSSNKDCYLCFAGNYTEDSFYCYHAEKCINCCDCNHVHECELCYENIQSEHCYNTQYCLHCSGCADSYFLEDCRECKHCFMCFNLTQKQYCIFNEQYTREQYFEQLKSYKLHTHSGKIKAIAMWHQKRLQFPKSQHHNRLAEDSSGEYLNECKNCVNCYTMSSGCQDCKNVFSGFPELTDAQDCTYCGEKTSLMYENLASGENCRSLLFCNIVCTNSSNMIYSDLCFGSHNCFGSTCLNKKQYCILNKQYTKQEYEKLVPRIIEHMKTTGEWGEFFPVHKSIFAYNETQAFEHFPLTQKEVLKRGWRWLDYEEETPNVSKFIPALDLPDSIDDIPDDILNWAITCERTEVPFKITPHELRFYRQHRISIPRLCPEERHKDRFVQRNKHTAYNRQCAKCSADIQTTYAPERPETVYCEACYLSEVY